MELESINFDAPLTLGVGWRTSSKSEVGRVELTQTLAEEFRSIAQEHANLLRSRTAKEYSPESDLEPREEYFVVKRSGLEGHSNTLDPLDAIADRDPLSPVELPKKPLLFYAFILPDATFLRKANSHLNAKTGRIFTRFSDSLSRVDEPLFSFDRSVDLVVTRQALLISQLTAFEFLFKDEAIVLKQVPVWARAIADCLPAHEGISDALLKRATANRSFRKRLEALNKRGHLRAVSIEQVKAEADKQGLDVATLFRDDKLDFTEANADTLLKLLNEDLFQGGLSGESFVVEKKSRR